MDYTENINNSLLTNILGTFFLFNAYLIRIKEEVIIITLKSGNKIEKIVDINHYIQGVKKLADEIFVKSGLYLNTLLIHLTLGDHELNKIDLKYHKKLCHF